MPDLKKSLAYLYLQQSRLRRDIAKRQPPLVIEGTKPFKRYPSAERVLLPRRWDGGEENLWEVLQKRRSARKYLPDTISKVDLALLLWACQGVTAQAGPYYLRTAPSAGALYPLETYVYLDRVEGIPRGMFHFDVKGFQLETLYAGTLGDEVAAAALGQAFFARAAVVFMWSAVMRRSMAKYGNRAMRYIFMEAGHVAQNLLLASQALGLSACPVGAFFDDEMDGLLGLDSEEETVIYLAAVGPAP